jgi:starch synthase
VFFCRAVVELVRLLNLRPDVIHCNDWQTGLIPAYMKTEYRHTPGYGGIGTLMTVHNMAYQGVFPHWDMQLTGLDWKYFNYHQMEFYGRLNLLKTGLVFADWLTTVSPRYAQEIQRGPLGCGLEGMLRSRSDTLTGIVNGVDYSLWDPRNDPHLARPYDTSCWRTSKPVCKAALQHELGLPEHPATPLLAFIGRFAAQKGFDLLAPLMRRWAATQDVQWVVLGTGELQYYDMLRDLTRQFPDRVAARLSFDDAMAHRIEAGADMLVIPSQFEPCGLNQLYSLRYGTVPVVHATGGLADTICDATAVAFNQGAANGFLFHVYDEKHLEDALLRAVTMYRQPQRGWSRLVETGMRQDWSWDQSARQYAELYAAAQRRAAL